MENRNEMNQISNQFSPLGGLSCKLSKESPLMLEVNGDWSSKEALIKKLTLFHKANYFTVKKAQEIVHMYGSYHGTLNPWQSRQLEMAQQQIEELGDEIYIEMYEHSNGKLLVPVGYYWLFSKYDDGFSPLNSKIKLVLPDGVSLRDYQVESLEKMLTYKRSMGVLATGLGKSMLILGICYSAFRAGKRSCVVVPNVELVSQMLGLLKHYIPSSCGLGGAHKFELGSDVLVTTAHSAMKEVDKFDVLVLDEGHHLSAATWLNLLTNCEKADYVYGLTATPYREDGMDLALFAFCGKIVVNKTCKWGIEQGWLKPASVYSVTVPVKDSRGREITLSKDVIRAKAYKTLVQSGSVFKELQKRLLAAQAAGRRCLVLFKTVTAGKAFIAFCGGSLNMKLAEAKSKKAIDEFRKGTVQILVSNDRLLSEGIDIPACNCLFTLLNNKSRITTMQAVGRILRKEKGNAIVVDIVPLGFKPFEEYRKVRLNTYLEITHDIKELSV